MTRKLIATLATATLIGGTAMAETPEDNMKVVQDFFAAYSANDLDGILQRVAVGSEGFSKASFALP